MSTNTHPAWASTTYCLQATADGVDRSLASKVYQLVCRSDFSAPGFCLLDLGSDVNSPQLRRFVVTLKAELAELHRQQRGNDLVYVSAGRFDQQTTTKFHRDGGPDENLLLLGYEPSPVEARLAMADYCRCAADRGLTPQEFLERHNPMFAAGEQLLRDYTTEVACFSNARAQVLVINNSLPPSRDGSSWQGVLHTATIQNPSDDLRRVVNSTMIASVSPASVEGISSEELQTFLLTDQVRRRGYDKSHLEE